MVDLNFIDFIAFHLGVTLSLEHSHYTDDNGESTFYNEMREGYIFMDLLGCNFQALTLNGQLTNFWTPVLREKSLYQILIYDGLAVRDTEQITKREGRLSLLQRAYTCVLLGADPSLRGMYDFCLILVQAISFTYAMVMGEDGNEENIVEIA